MTKQKRLIYKTMKCLSIESINTNLIISTFVFCILEKSYSDEKINNQWKVETYSWTM